MLTSQEDFISHSKWQSRLTKICFVFSSSISFRNTESFRGVPAFSNPCYSALGAQSLRCLAEACKSSGGVEGAVHRMTPRAASQLWYCALMFLLCALTWPGTQPAVYSGELRRYGRDKGLHSFPTLIINFIPTFPVQMNLSGSLQKAGLWGNLELWVMMLSRG